MRAHDLEVLLLSNEPNIRYATGATAMPVYAMSTFVRCAVVPQEGTPILFEHANSMHRSALRAPDVRAMHAWEFTDDPRAEADGWADLGRGRDPRARCVRDDGRRRSPRRAGVPRTRGSRCGDPRRGAGHAGPPREDAAGAGAPRPEQCPRDGDARGVRGGRPAGMRERDLLAVIFDTMIRGGGEYLATNTVCSGPNTNPWRAEATDRALEAGDLVFVDTDTVGIEGMFSCVSRTFPVGDGAVGRPARRLPRGARVAPRDGGAGASGAHLRELATLAPPIRLGTSSSATSAWSTGSVWRSPSVCNPSIRSRTPRP